MNHAAQPRELPHAILVVGDGQVGVLTAIALRQALPTTTVTVIPSPADHAAFADRIGTAMPFTNRLHDRLGISEMDLVQRAFLKSVQNLMLVMRKLSDFRYCTYFTQN